MLSENDGDCQERISRRVEFKTSYSVESLTSGSSDGESYSPRLPHVRRRDSLLQRTKSFSQIIHEMGSNTKKLEEEMYGLLRDMVSFYFNKNLFCCHIRPSCTKTQRYVFDNRCAQRRISRQIVTRKDFSSPLLFSE